MHGEDVRGPLGIIRAYPRESVLRALAHQSPRQWSLKASLGTATSASAASSPAIEQTAHTVR